MGLREYQTSLIDKLYKAWEDGYKAPCLVLPCGGGKSIITAEIAKRHTDLHKHVLFLVHRRELVEQIESTFKSWGVNMELCSISMVQTVSRHINDIYPPFLIITDENHHSKANSYVKIYKFFPGARRVGVTATPTRLDGSGLSDVNDKLIIGVTPQWLIANNFLSDYRYYAPTISNLPKFHTRNGEFVQSEVLDFLDKPKIYGDVIDNYKKFANGKQTIVYLPAVKMSKETAKQFNDVGIRAEHIDGETSKSERTTIIDKFRTGEIKVLCNVDLISEGFDVPDCQCAILLRPTKSLSLYIQQAMRCMRYKANKEAIIIDQVENYKRFGLPDQDREWTLKGHKKAKSQTSVNDGAVSVKVCKECFCTVNSDEKVCPNCGCTFPKTEREIKQEKEAEIKEIDKKVVRYVSVEECTNVKELFAFAKHNGYKPGWAYYRAKEKGWLKNERGNKHSKSN